MNLLKPLCKCGLHLWIDKIDEFDWEQKEQCMLCGYSGQNLKTSRFVVAILVILIIFIALSFIPPNIIGPQG